MTKRENYLHFLKNEPYEWVPSNLDQVIFLPAFLPENVARGFVMQAKPFPRENYGGKDWFGVDWIFEPQVNGSIERAPLFDDISDWEKYIKFPDLSAMDWEAAAKENEALLNTDKMVAGIMYTGYFERMISFVGFENAIMAMIDEDCREAINKLFDKLTDFYIECIKYTKKYFNMEYITFHDDWGTQVSTMFSVDTHAEVILPHLTRLIDAAHKEGVFIEIHSCGKIETLLPNIIKSGADGWRGQTVNDKAKLVDMYGDEFKFVVEGWIPGATDEEEVAHVTNLVRKYKGKRIALSINPAAPKTQLDMMLAAIHKECGVE